MQPEDFGWKIVDGKLTPVMMTKPIAPDCLLNIFKCGCKGDCRTKRCSCFKNGLECSSACTECHGMACLNSPHIDEEIDCVDEETDDIERILERLKFVLAVFQQVSALVLLSFLDSLDSFYMSIHLDHLKNF